MPGIRQVGDWIAERFEVFEIHEGGMGVVYVARDRLGTSGHEVVALKTLHDELLFDRGRRERFAAECHLWVHLGRHPNIVEAFAVEEIDGRPHIVLELVTGGELRRRIGTPRLDPPRTLRFGVEFCLGMEHAIRQGLRCHRDIKPGNLLVTEAGKLKITDFGLAGIRDEILAAGPDLPDEPIPLEETFLPQRIVWNDPRDHVGQARPPVEPTPSADESSGIAGAGARAVDPATVLSERPIEVDPRPGSTVDYTPPNRGGPNDTTISRLTRTGVMLGTLPYMAPEQFRDAKGEDIRADIYSFGIVLFQMLTADLPFKGDTPAKFDRQHSHYDPPSVIPFIPRRFAREATRIDGIVKRCLAKDPADRYATVAGLRRALTDALRRLDRNFDPRR